MFLIHCQPRKKRNKKSDFCKINIIVVFSSLTALNGSKDMDDALYSGGLTAKMAVSMLF